MCRGVKDAKTGVGTSKGICNIKQPQCKQASDQDHEKKIIVLRGQLFSHLRELCDNFLLGVNQLILGWFKLWPGEIKVIGSINRHQV